MTVNDKIVQLANQLQAAITKATPEAWTATLKVYQINALQTLILSIVGLIAAIVLGIVAWRLIAKGETLHRKYWEPETPASAPDGAAHYVFGVISGISAGVLIAMSVIYLISPWTYVALTNPALAVTRDALAKVMH